jgi:hypothetical protein
MPNIPKGLSLARRSRKETGPAARKSVQLSNALMGALDDRAAQEALPLATVVRRSVLRLLHEVEATGVLPAIDLDAAEDTVRTGRRGPTTQWPERVSYVLPREDADRLDKLAWSHGVSAAELVRAALHFALTEPIASVRPLRTTETGFVTASAPQGAAARARQNVELLDRLRNR